MTAPDIAGLCERLRRPTVLTSYDGLDPVVLGPTDIRIEAADTIERQAAENKRLREALANIQIEAEREEGRWVHLKRVIAINARAALTGED